MTTATTPRRFALNRDLLADVAALNPEDKQAFAIFINRFRMGAPASYEPLPGSSALEGIRLEARHPLLVVVKRAGSMHLLLRLVAPENAQRWAQSHRCEINEKLGMVQIYEMPAVAAPQSTGSAARADLPAQAFAKTATADRTACRRPGLFDELQDDDLLAIGLPKHLLTAVRALETPDDLEAMQHRLPDLVYEALTWFVQGEKWSEVLAAYQEACSDEQALVATEAGKLDAGRFRVITSDEELRSMMDKPLAQWRVFLHPMQKEIVDKPWKGAVLITGGAGTGKTVAALHRARRLVRLPDWRPGDRLLFTTFTKNLAIDLGELLKQICTRDEMNRIEVANIDAWLATFIRQHGADKRIVYPGGKDGIFEECWNNAWATFTPPVGMDRPKSFYRSEFDEVILAQHIHASKDYLFADRKGRGALLSRLQRKAIWPLFEEMRLQLQLHNAMTVEDAAAFAAQSVRNNCPDGMYRAVIADEIQDFKPDMLKLLRALACDVSKMPESIEGDLFLTGDPHQRIYGRPVAFSACGIAVRGRSRKLRLNYRTTDEIRKTADAVYKGVPVDDMNGQNAEPAGYAALRHGAKPQRFLAGSFNEEIDWIASRIRILQTQTGYDAKDICIVLRTNDAAQNYAAALRHRSIPIVPISRSRPDDPDMDGVRTATMHRVKGLEFKAVFIAGIDSSFPRLPSSNDADAEAALAAERALLYVAASRASDLLFFSASGSWSPMLESLGIEAAR